MACAQCGLITYTTRFCRCTILTWSRHVHASFCLLEGIQKPNGIYCLLMSDWHQSSFSSYIATWGANKIEKGSISVVTLLYNYLHLSGWLGNLIVSRPALGACLQQMCNTLTRDNCPARNIFRAHGTVDTVATVDTVFIEGRRRENCRQLLHL